MIDNYVKPWCRFSPYIVGILLGYFLHITKGKPFKMSKVTNLWGWVIAMVTGLAIVYGLNIPNHINGESLTGLSMVWLVTCFHEFQIYESTNFFHKKMFCFLLAKCLFFVKINSFSNLFDLNRKILPRFKRKQEKFGEKRSWIRKFGIRENMS